MRTIHEVAINALQGSWIARKDARLATRSLPSQINFAERTEPKPRPPGTGQTRPDAYPINADHKAVAYAAAQVRAADLGLERCLYDAGTFGECLSGPGLIPAMGVVVASPLDFPSAARLTTTFAEPMGVRGLSIQTAAEIVQLDARRAQRSKETPRAQGGSTPGATLIDGRGSQRV